MGSVWLDGEAALTTACDDSALEGIGLGVAKKDRAAILKSDKKTYFKIRDNAVQGLPSKFTQLQAIDEKSTLEHLEKVYSVVNRFSDLQLQLEKNDMQDVFTVPDSFVLDTTTNHYVPAPHAVGVNLFTDSNRVDLETIKRATAFHARFGPSYHGENILWSGEMILNSCAPSLRDKLVESTRNWPCAKIGGPSYLKLLLALVLSTTPKTCRILMDKIGRLRITDFPGENVTTAVSFLRGAILILRDNSSTPSDLINLVLRVFKGSTCTPFNNYILSIAHFVELGVKSYGLDKLLTMLDTKYIELLGLGEWTSTSPTEGQQSGFTANLEDVLRIICYNCGGVGHGVDKCPQPRDDRLINLRREIMNNSGGRRKRDDHGNGRGDGQGEGHGDPLRQPPSKNASHEKFFDGIKKFWCGRPGCRCWTDHLSREHPGGAAANVVADVTIPNDAPSVAGTEVSAVTGVTGTNTDTATQASGNFVGAAGVLPTITHHFG